MRKRKKNSINFLNYSLNRETSSKTFFQKIIMSETFFRNKRAPSSRCKNFLFKP